MPRGYVISLDLSGKRVVVVGGGAVAARKARSLLAAGAGEVVVVSPTFDDSMPDEATRLVAFYDAGQLRGAALVFAATNDPAVNARVVTDARAIGALASRADIDDADPADFSTPARLDKGDITLSVSAGSAALSAAIRDGLAARFDPRWIAMAEAMVFLRPLIRDHSTLSPAQRATLFRDLASEDAMDVLDRTGRVGLIEWIEQRHGVHIDS